MKRLTPRLVYGTIIYGILLAILVSLPSEVLIPLILGLAFSGSIIYIVASTISNKWIWWRAY